MTTTPPDDRNPLSRALYDASTGPEARSYAVPVKTVRQAARRRRAWRTGGTAAVAVALVGVVVGGAYAGRPSWRAVPAQFDRCGTAVDDVLPPLGDPATLVLTDESWSVPADGAWTASVTADVPTAHDGQVAVVWATDLAVVSNGVVVGVQDGPTAPDLSASLDERLGGGSLPTSPFPTTTDVTLALAPCDRYPTGPGSPHLAPGRYDLVVTQTISYASAGVATKVTDVRVSARTAVTVTAPATTAAATATSSAGALPDLAVTDPPPPIDPIDAIFRCGQAPTVAPTTLPDVAGLMLAADIPDAGWTPFGDPGWTAVLTSAGGRAVHGQVKVPVKVAFVDGNGLVAGLEVSGSFEWAPFAVTTGTPATFAGGGEPNHCGPDGQLASVDVAMPAGTYWAWPYAMVTVDSVSHPDGTVDVPPDGEQVVVGTPHEVTFGG